jgi:CRP/FNR family transcriptional regulator, transcriptional activator FtrB
MLVTSAVLRTLPLFAGLGEASLERLSASTMHVLPPDRVLFRAGERSECLFVLCSGLVELASGDGDDAATVDVLRTRGVAFPLSAVLLDQPAVTGARTISKAELLGLPAAMLRALLPTEPALGAALLAATAAQTRSLLRQTGELKRRTAAQRLGCFLLTLADEQSASGALRLPFGKRLLSSCLGMTAEHLSRAFATLRRYGVRTGNGRTVWLSDRASLVAFARPDEPPKEAGAAPARAMNAPTGAPLGADRIAVVATVPPSVGLAAR